MGGAGGPAATDWALLWRLAPLLVLAAAFAIPAQLRAVATARGLSVPEWPAALLPTLAVATIAVLAAVAGTAAASRVGLSTPVLRPGAGGDLLAVLTRTVGGGAGVGLVVAGVTLPFYYAVLRPLFDPEEFRLVENVRQGMGLPALIALGGVIEEVIFRWGVLAVIAWTGLQLTGDVGHGVRWSATLGAALLFGLVHLPGAAGLGIRISRGLVLASLAMNGALGVAAGWLAWHLGLVAAITVHATVHVVWSAVEPLDAV